jgi:hypothetical protein
MKKSRLKSVVLRVDHILIPASFFIMVLGLVGLGSCWGCVAKNDGGLVEVVFVLTYASLTHPSMDPKYPFKWRHYVRFVVG